MTIFRNHISRLCFAFLAVAAATPSRAQIITTIAGHFGTATVVDSISATTARLVAPQAVVRDAAGNTYVADAGNYRIRKIDASGIITTYAGTGIMGFSGDAGPATAANISQVLGMCIDAGGNLYLADAINHRVRKITAGGIISTVAGNGTSGYAGDGAPAVTANLFTPADVALDVYNNLFIADRDNHCIRKVDPAGYISTVAGLGSPGFTGDGFAATSGRLNLPTGIAVDVAGNLFIADQMNGRIRKVDAGGYFSTIAGTGMTGYNGDGIPATAADLHQPSKVAVDDLGSVYISDQSNNRIRMIDGSGTINTVVGSGVNGFSGDGAAATGAMINNPAGLFLNSDIIYFADAGNNRIRTVSTTNIINTIAGVDRYIGDGGPATAADLLTPQQLCIDKAGNLYFTETNGNRVRKISPSGIITTLAGNGIGTSAGDGGPATAASLYLPEAIDVDTAGNVYIGEFNGIIRKVTPAGIISTIAGNGTLGFCGDGGPALSACLGTQSLTVGQAGNMYLSEGGFARVRHIDASGIINSIAGIGVPGYSGDGGAATDAQLSYPLGIQADGMGNIYIADHGNSVIRKIDAAGDITTVAGNGTGAYGGDGGPATAASLYHAACIKLIAHGNMLIADGWNNRIRLLTADGNISTIAGTGAYGYSGDGGNPLAAELWLPTGITIDTAGNIYFVDGGTYVIRKISNWTPPIGVGVSSPTAQNIKAIVSPNPATNYIDITAIKTITSLSITNVLGQQVLTNTTCNDTHLHLNIEHLSPGTYFIRINGNETIKFLKQ